MDRDAKRRELEELRARVQRLEAELAAEESKGEWPPRGFYTAYYVLGGFVLGIFGAATSLLFNVVGSLLVGQHPLYLIKVYLTFPLAERGLEIDDGLTLAVGVCLYLLTGMALGIPFHVILSRWFVGSSLGKKLVVVSALALAVWLINFYAILSWLQPALFGGRWIVDLIPWWVGAATHLVFGWTMLLVQPLGTFVAFSRLAEER
ncbi:MAG: hypothetical protein NZO58_12335 [Gemmataceae bacterium]|nr:hypothetical protein [Gemmataceae bacterium]